MPQFMRETYGANALKIPLNNNNAVLRTPISRHR